MKFTSKQTSLWLLVIAAIACNLFGNREPKSGLQYLLKVECKETDCNKVVEQTIKIIESRSYAIGVNSKGERGKNPDEIIFRVEDTKDVERVKRVLFSYDRVELLAVVSPASPSPAQTYKTIEEAKAIAKEGEEVLPYIERPETTEGKSYVIVKTNSIVANEDIRYAQAVPRTGAAGDYQINFTLKPESATKFGNWTEANINQYLAVALNKEIKTVAAVRGKITDSGELTGSFAKQSAEDLAFILNSGRFPAPLKLIEEKTFGK